MNLETKNNIKEILACPVCKGSITSRPEVISCSACGRDFVQKNQKFIDLLPQDKAGNTDFNNWNKRQEAFVNWLNNGWNERLAVEARALYDDFFEYVGSVRGLTLDIGCGYGHLNNRLKSSTYIGIEPEADLFLNYKPDFMCRIFPCDDNNFILVRGFGEYLPFQEGVFDNVFMTNMLDHASDPYEVLREASRVVKTGGTVYIMHEDNSLIKKMASRGIRRVLKEGFRRLSRLIILKPVRTPHINLSRDDLDNWLREHFVVESVFSKRRSHIFFKAVEINK
jgi:SAM-dependent methyltransferase